jgi:hypothetical protein
MVHAAATAANGCSQSSREEFKAVCTSLQNTGTTADGTHYSECRGAVITNFQGNAYSLGVLRSLPPRKFGVLRALHLKSFRLTFEIMAPRLTNL